MGCSIMTILCAYILGIALANTKQVMLIGPTGVGKSFIGNALLGKRSFKVSAGSGHSLTSDTDKGQAPVKVGGENLDLTIWDTPGLGDTEGRSLKFLDMIMHRLKSVQPDAVILVTNDQRFTLEVQVGLRALRECFGDALLPYRVFLLANKMVTPFQLENDDPPITDEVDQQEHIKMLTERRRQEISNFMGLTQPHKMLTTVVANSAEKKDGIPVLLKAIHTLPDTPWNVNSAKSFTQVMKDAKSAVHNHADLVKQADERKNSLQNRIENLRSDLASYKTKNGWAAAVGAGAASIVSSLGAASTNAVATAAASSGMLASAATVASAVATAATPVAILIYGAGLVTFASSTAYTYYARLQMDNIEKALHESEAEMQELQDEEKMMKKVKADAEQFLVEMRELEYLLNAKLNDSKITDL